MSEDLFRGSLARAKRAALAEHLAPGAIFSPDRKRRYVLARQVGAGEKIAAFVMLNPSKAGEDQNDNTVTKCCEFARLWGCGWLLAVNLVPWVSTDPLGLYILDQFEVLADREANRMYVLRAARAAAESGGPVVCAWGTHGCYLDSDLCALSWLRAERIAARCLGSTCEGYPRHPGRIAYATPLEPYPTPEQLAHLEKRGKR